MKTKVNLTPEDFIQVNSNSFGHPRYVCHFLNFITEEDYNKVKDNFNFVQLEYNIALNKVKRSPLNGKKFNNKQYGGGIVFVSWNIQDTCNKINNTLNK